MTNSFANEKVTCEISTPLRLKINMCNINTFANEIIIREISIDISVISIPWV